VINKLYVQAEAALARHRGKATPGVVRCLGVGPEHRWASPDRRRVRVCPACRDRLAKLRIGALAGRPAANDPTEG
jgi:hypothetical protein